MEQTSLPGTDITVSKLALGCWGLVSDFHWGERDLDKSKATIQAALDAGITFFDTAAMYADGASESLLGEVLSDRRDQVQIATKSSPAQTSADEVKEGLEQSLGRLKTDYVDMYQIHWAGSDAELADVWGGLIELKQAGKARSIGVCNLGPSQLEVVNSLESPSTNQLPYNLLFRAIEHEILPSCKKSKTGVLVYSPLMHGILRGEWKTADDVPLTRARTRHFSSEREHTRHSDAGHEDLTFDTLECLKDFAELAHTSLLQLSLGWLAANKQVTSILVGASSPEQIQANAQMLAKPLDKDLLKQVKQVTDPLKEAMGTNVDLWQSEADSRVR